MTMHIIREGESQENPSGPKRLVTAYTMTGKEDYVDGNGEYDLGEDFTDTPNGGGFDEPYLIWYGPAGMEDCQNQNEERFCLSLLFEIQALLLVQSFEYRCRLQLAP